MKKNKLISILFIFLFPIISVLGQGVELVSNENITDLKYIYPLNEGLSKVMKDNMWGFIDSDKKLKISLKYDDASSFTNGIARVQRGSKFSAINLKGKQIMPWFDYVYPFYNNLAKVKNRNKLAFVNRKGKIVSDWFDSSYMYYYGLRRVKKGHKWAFIDKKGKVVTNWYYHSDTLNRKILIKTQIEKLPKPPYEKRSVSIYNEKRERITDKFPTIFYSRRYESTTIFDSLLFNQDLATAKHTLYTENISMIRNKKGQFAFQNDGGLQLTDWFLEAENYYEGVARVVNMEGKMAYFGNNGRQITNWHDRVYPFFNRLAIVENNGKFAFIDKMGNLKTGWFDYASQFSDGLAKVCVDRKWGFINDKGRMVINLIYDDAVSFSYGYAKVEIDGKDLLINKRNKVMHGAFDFIDRFTDSIAAINVDGKYAYVDRRGKPLTPWLDCASEFSYGIARVCLNGKVALIDNNARRITPWYEKAFLASAHLVLGDTLPHGKVGRYILFDLYKYDNYFNKYSSNINYDRAYQMTWNYTDREAPMSWNDGFFKEGIQVVYKPKGEILDVDVFAGAALADYNDRRLSIWYDSIFKSDDGLIVAKKDNKSVLLNLYGDEISKKYDGIYYYKPNEILIELEGKFTFIDRKDKFLTLWYNEIADFNEGYTVVKLEEQYALMTDEFNVISNWYEYIDNEFTTDMRRVKRNGMWGAISKQGFDVVKVKYESASFINGLLRVELEGSTYFYDINGNLIKTE